MSWVRAPHIALTMPNPKKECSLNEEALSQRHDGNQIRIKYYVGLGWAPVISNKEKQ